MSDPTPATTVVALDRLDAQLRALEKRARSEGAAFWKQESKRVFDATDFAFLLRNLRSLVLLLNTQEVFLQDLCEKVVTRCTRADADDDTDLRIPSPRRRMRRPNCPMEEL